MTIAGCVFIAFALFGWLNTNSDDYAGKLTAATLFCVGVAFIGASPK